MGLTASGLLWGRYDLETQFALAWVAARPIAAVISGARSVDQAASNAVAGAGTLVLSGELPERIAGPYDRDCRADIHGRW